MKLVIKEEFDNEVYRDLEEKLIDAFYQLSETELLACHDSGTETGGGAIWILPDGKTIELDLHQDFGSEAFYRFCEAYFKEHSEYSEDYSADDFALEDAFEFNDHLSYALGWAKFNTGTFYDDRYYLVPPRQRMTNNQFRTLEAILEETSDGVDSLLVLPWVTSSVTYYFSKHTPKSIVKSLQKFYTSGILEESKSLQGVRLYLGQDGEKLGGLFIETGKLLKQLWDDDDEHYDDINHFLSKLEYLLDVPDLDYKNNKYNFAFKKSAITPEIREIIDDLDYYLNELDYEVIEETTETANIEYEDDIQFAYKINENYLVEATERYNGMIFTDSPYTIRDYCVNRPDAYRILYDANIDLYMLCDASLHIHWDLINQAYDLGFYSELKIDETLDEVVRDYIADRDLFNYTDIGCDGFYDNGDDCIEIGQYLMYAIWVPNGMNEDEIDNSPSSDGYDDEFEFPAGSLFTRGLDTDLMNKVDLINILRRSQPANKETKQRYELLKSRIGDNKIMKEQIKPNKPEYVELEFCDLPITIQSSMDWNGDYREKEISKDYTMRLTKDNAITVIIEDFIDETDIPNINDISDEDIEKFVVDNFDSLFNKYYDKFLNKFEDDAIEECESDYGWDDYESDERDDYADFLYDQYRDDQYESAVTITAKDTLTENWDNNDTEFIDYVLNQFNEFLKTWPTKPYNRDSDFADVDTLISRFLTKGLTEEKVQQIINDMEYYLDYSGVELDDDVDLNKGSIWDWTDKYTHYLIVEQNFAEVLDTVGYEKAKELVLAWKQSNEIKSNIKTENLINREEPPYYNFNEFWFFVAKYWLDCDAERSALNDAFDYGMSHPEAAFNDCPVFYDRYNHEGEYLELAFEAGQESADFII